MYPQITDMWSRYRTGVALVRSAPSLYAVMNTVRLTELSLKTWLPSDWQSPTLEHGEEDYWLT